MDEKTILILVFGCLGYIASFFAGYCFCEFRRLAKDNRICETNGNSITRATERIDSSEGRVEDLKSATQSVLDTIRKYESTASENKELE